MKTPPPRPSRDPRPPSPAPTPAPVAPTWLPHRLPIALLWAVTLLAYSNSFQSGLIFDNASRIREDPRIQSASPANIALIFHSDYWHPHLGSGIYRPLTTLSFLFNYAILGNGDRPFGYHVVNWMLHSLNVSLLYLLALRLLKEKPAAFAVAAIWAVHPVLTESVTNVVGRADILAGLGLIGGVLAYLQAADTTGPLRWRWLAAAALASTIGVFSKESAAVVLLAALLYDLYERRKPWAPGYAALAAPVAVYWILRTQAFAHAVPRVVPFTDNPMAGAGWLSARLTAMRVIGKEILLLLWPIKLSPDYSYNQIPLAGPGDWQPWAAVVVCLLLAAGAVLMYRRKNAVCFWIGLFFITLAPTSNLLIIIGSPMAERLLYLPAIGVAGCVVAAVSAGFSGARTRTGFAVLGVCGLLLAGRTFWRNFDWQDERTLWTSAVAISPDSYKTHLTLAAANPEVALQQTEIAISIVDRVPDQFNPAVPYINGGKLHRERGDRIAKTSPDEARSAYQRALDVLLHADRIRRAHDDHNRAVAERTGTLWAPLGASTWAPLYQELGRVYERTSRYDEAIQAQRTALRFKIAPELFESLSVTYYRKGDPDRAAIALLEGILVDQRNSKLASEVATLYQQTDPNGCALQSVGGQSGLNLNCASVHRQFCAAALNLVRLYRETNQAAAAAQAVQSATDSLRCDPSTFQ